MYVKRLYCYRMTIQQNSGRNKRASSQKQAESSAFSESLALASRQGHAENGFSLEVKRGTVSGTSGEDLGALALLYLFRRSLKLEPRLVTDTQQSHQHSTLPQWLLSTPDSLTSSPLSPPQPPGLTRQKHGTGRTQGPPRLLRPVLCHRALLQNNNKSIDSGFIYFVERLGCSAAGRTAQYQFLQ